MLSPLSQLDELRGQTPDSLPPAEEQDRVRGEGLQRHGYDGDQHLGPEMYVCCKYAATFDSIMFSWSLAHSLAANGWETND